MPDLTSPISLTPLEDRLDPGANRPKDAVRAAREFEAFFVKELLGQLRKSVGDGGLFQRSETRGYDSILDDALARSASEKRGLGLAEQLLRDWERLGVIERSGAK